MEDWEAFTREEAARQGLDPDLAVRVMRQESGGDQRAVSPKGAVGRMQLMPGTARDMGVNPKDPYQNIVGGVRYLKQNMDEFGSPELALAAYNAGPDAVRKHGGMCRLTPRRRST
jgi:soluble lytic murein transglycosylase-like protein